MFIICYLWVLDTAGCTMDSSQSLQFQQRWTKESASYKASAGTH